MENWIFSVGCMVLITSLLSMIIPEGKLNTSIKSILSLMIILVMVRPIIDVKNLQSFQDVFNQNSSITLQVDFLEYVNKLKMTNLEKECVKIIDKIGVKDAEVIIEYIVDEQGQATIISITINLKNKEFTTQKEHIVVIEEITTNICSFLSIDKNKVVIYE